MKKTALLLVLLVCSTFVFADSTSGISVPAGKAAIVLIRPDVKIPSTYFVMNHSKAVKLGTKQYAVVYMEPKARNIIYGAGITIYNALEQPRGFHKFDLNPGDIVYFQAYYNGYLKEITEKDFSSILKKVDVTLINPQQ